MVLGIVGYDNLWLALALTEYFSLFDLGVNRVNVKFLTDDIYENNSQCM